MISQKLKELGLTKVDFAKRLEISRPTLDRYIKDFDNGITIIEPYNNLFVKLFTNDLDDDEFEKLIDKFLVQKNLLIGDIHRKLIISPITHEAKLVYLNDSQLELLRYLSINGNVNPDYIQDLVIGNI